MCPHGPLWVVTGHGAASVESCRQAVPESGRRRRRDRCLAVRSTAQQAPLWRKRRGHPSSRSAARWYRRAAWATAQQRAADDHARQRPSDDRNTIANMADFCATRRYRNAAGSPCRSSIWPGAPATAERSPPMTPDLGRTSLKDVHPRKIFDRAPVNSAILSNPPGAKPSLRLYERLWRPASFHLASRITTRIRRAPRRGVSATARRPQSA